MIIFEFTAGWIVQQFAVEIKANIAKKGGKPALLRRKGGFGKIYQGHMDTEARKGTAEQRKPGAGWLQKYLHFSLGVRSPCL